MQSDHQKDMDRLVEFSKAVRESTLKRLRLVPEGLENWRPSMNAMSFADIAHHLIECDLWLLKKVVIKNLAPLRGQNQECIVTDRDQFNALINTLNETGANRNKLIQSYAKKNPDEIIYDQRFGDVSVWWIIVRGNIDHEIHHRGQLATYLRIIQDNNLTE
ncbi:DinB family protein [candidate division KSB1 bacterium]|nr:DinB family protein [candidate division KSB1 bacterium]